jgi:hypothetical protein
VLIQLTRSGHPERDPYSEHQQRPEVPCNIPELSAGDNQYRQKSPAHPDRRAAGSFRNQKKG